jgi:hypothetical protein
MRAASRCEPGRTRVGVPGSGARPRSGGGPPVWHGFSPVVVPRPADWPAEIGVAGYWWPAYPRGWRPPGELVSFLQAGPVSEPGYRQRAVLAARQIAAENGARAVLAQVRRQID